jgi:hypothetical protein
MTTRLERVLKRELAIGKDAYTLSISPDGFKLVPKGKRNGIELAWADVVSGQAALAVALNASLEFSAEARPERQHSPAKSKQESTSATTRQRSSKRRRNDQRA